MALFASGLVLRSLVSCRPLSKIRPSLQTILRQDLTHPLQIFISTPAPGYRHLYSASYLGINGYIKARQRFEIQIQGAKDEFRERMKKIISDCDTLTIDDLKLMLHIAEATEDDLTLVKDMIKKFGCQSKDLKFSEYAAGPVAMRLFHHHAQPEIALELLKMMELEEFFGQVSSFKIALDLLYEHQRYTDVIDVFEIMRERRLYGYRYDTILCVFPLAAFYKMNTPESFEMMMALSKELDVSFNDFYCKVFAAMLAQRQGYPHVCLEIMSSLHQITHQVVRNLKAISLTEMGKAEAALPIFHSVLQFGLPSPNDFYKQCMICRDTIDMVQRAIEETDNKELIVELQQIVKKLEDNDAITDKTLEELMPVRIFTGAQRNYRNRRPLNASFNSRIPKSGNRYKKPPRPSLMDSE